jgi:hypothetical protein
LTGNGIQTGDWIIYRKTKFSTHPGPRAQNVSPAEHGDEYAYTVDKFWIVAEVRSDGTLLLRTRKGKAHAVRADDPNLRKANWWDRWRFRERFESIDAAPPAPLPPQKQHQPAT